MSRGPANRRQCEVPAAGWTQPAAVADLAAFLQSRPFLDYVHAFTVTPLDGGYFPQQLAQWRHGSYTLVHDDALEEPGLDVIFTLTDTAEVAARCVCVRPRRHEAAHADEAVCAP